MYTERNGNLCVIQDILEYAFLDDAFASERIRRPLVLNKCPGSSVQYPYTLKKSVQEMPVVWRPTPERDDPTLAPHTLEHKNTRSTRKSAGFKESRPLYKYRKGATANPSKEYILRISINLYLQDT